MKKAKRVPISLRMPEPTLHWFRNKQPKGYQSLIHSVLDEYVNSEMKKEHRMAGRAQEIFRAYYAQCFWHYDKNLKITPANIKIVIDGLKKHGGRDGLLLAEELCQ